MNKTIVGAFLIIVLVTIAAVGVKLLLPMFEDARQKATTDATKTKGKIRIAVDNWVGYSVLCSPELKSAVRKSGYLLVCEDDNADYAKRMERLDAGEIDFAVATVDSYILNASRYQYPGAIVMVIDESKGGDAILARKDRISSLDAMKGTNDIRVAFTPGSPSHHFLKAAADHFDVPELLPSGALRIETEGSEKAREKLIAGQTDVAVCWEPDVSRALATDGIIKILGTEDTERLIVDILVAGRRIIEKNPETVSLLLNQYFRVLKKYRDNPESLLDHVKSASRLPKNTVTAMLDGVKWANFGENCEKWFGIAAPGQYSDEGLIDTITATAKILESAGDFSSDPIPSGDPYRLTNSGFLEKIFTAGISGFTKPGSGISGTAEINSLETRFSALSDRHWGTLKEVGTLKVEPIVFRSGTSELELLAKKVVDQAVDRLGHYPNFRVVINGHTGTRGDKKENMSLSRDRADAVARYLEVVYNVDPNRLRVVGHGGEKPLDMLPGESRRAWMYRLPRVELVLVREDY
ncbi:MAG: OmpA family protein [Desulfobacteraceae bacterium]|nr:OmpA family protein [Desulfobacteraceae bacterium]